MFLQNVKTEAAKKTKLTAKAEKIEQPKAALVPVKPEPEVQVSLIKLPTCIPGCTKCSFLIQCSH